MDSNELREARAMPEIKECEFGCIFDDKGRLTGDCRIPESKKCQLNIQYQKEHNFKQIRTENGEIH